MSKRRTFSDRPTPLAGDGDVVTSAPNSEVGSLLTDLLGEAKREVAAERARLEQQKQRLDAEGVASQKRAEALERERLQQELVAETRRRNEAFSRLEREQQLAALPPETVGVEPSKARVLAAPPSPQPRSSRWRWVAAAALVLSAGATTTVLAYSQPEGMAVPSVAGVADSAIGYAKLRLVSAALVENRAKATEAAEALKRAEGLAQKEAERAEREEALRRAEEARNLKLQLDDKRHRTDKPPTRTRRPPKSPKIDLKYFSDPK